MSCEIWRLVSLWIGRETTAGTEASTLDYLSLTSAPFIKPVIEYMANEGGIGRIEGTRGQTVVKAESETSIEGWVEQETFGNLMTALFGAPDASPALVETGVYKHSYTVQNDNSHDSYSIVNVW